ncbi:MAG TPA: hypothetical protein VF587_15870 [Solirubrobacteraceae bacterium]
MTLGLVDEADVRRHRRANAAFVWSYYVRFARLATRRGRARQNGAFVAIGVSNLEQIKESGRGAIVLSVHLGDFDAAGAWLVAEHGLTPVVVGRRITPRWRHALFTGVRRRCGVLTRTAESTTIADLEEDLVHGRLVLVMLDRRPPGATLTTNLLGRPSVASSAVINCAVRTGAPLFVAATWRTATGRPVAWFGQPTVVDSQADAVRALIDAAESLGGMIRTHPAQWHVPADLAELAIAPPPTTVAASAIARHASRLSVAGRAQFRGNAPMRPSAEAHNRTAR